MTIENTTKTATLFDAMLPGMIEASEARGQRQLVESELLPSDMKGKRATFERMGFKFGEFAKDDPLFIRAELPSGWKKRPTDHPMHSEIVDEKGAKRVGIFYKAAFYDRRADMHLVGRYEIEAGWGEPDFATRDAQVATVIDQKTGLYLYKVEGRRLQRDGRVTSACSDAEDKAMEWCKSNLPSDWVEAWFVD